MTNRVWEQIIHPLANAVGDASRLAEVKLPSWIKYRIVEKLYQVYKRRWRSWKVEKNGVEEDSGFFYDCDENGNSTIPPFSAILTEERIQNMLDCDLFQTSNGSTTSSSTDGLHTPRLRHLKKSGESLEEPVLTPIRSVVEGSIPITDVQITRLIGSGGFGSVYYGQLKDNTPVAVKRMHTSPNNVHARAESFQAELKVLKLNHPNIVKTLAASNPNQEDNDYESQRDGIYIIMEYTGDKNLQQIINDTNEGLDLSRRVHYSLQITNALQFIHNNQIVHLDIKPSNILICADDTLKVGDFGCCRAIQGDTNQTSPTQRSFLTGTFAYRAPELLRGDQASTKADIYSLGITLWQMLSRDLPFQGQSPHIVIFGVVTYNLRPMKCSEIDSKERSCHKVLSGVKTMSESDALKQDPIEVFYRDLFIQCWQGDPRNRPTAADLVEVFSVWKMYL